MRRWIYRSIFNILLFASALVVTSLFILQQQASNNQQSANYQYQQGLLIGRRIDRSTFDGTNDTNDEGYYDLPAVTEPTSTTSSNKLAKSKDSTDEIKCEINGNYSIKCLRFNGQVYFPFDFIQKYFDVYGKENPKEGNFQFEHSNSGHGSSGNASEQQQPKHVCDGPFMNFASFNVERRNKVKFVNVFDGLPMSIQWDTTKRGYHFATQISQFGLSYFSKYFNRKAKQANSILPNQPLSIMTTNSNSKCHISSSENYLAKFLCKCKCFLHSKYFFFHFFLISFRKFCSITHQCLKFTFNIVKISCSQYNF